MFEGLLVMTLCCNALHTLGRGFIEGSVAAVQAEHKERSLPQNWVLSPDEYRVLRASFWHD